MATFNGDINNNTFNGTAESDFFYGKGGNDILRGFEGYDFFEGGLGNDFMDGGSEIDTASYRDATVGVTVNLSITTAQATGWGNDTLRSIETLYGSDFGDTLTGNIASNNLYGYDGNDILSGDDGSDYLEGGNGNDRLFGGYDGDTLVGGLGDDLLNGGAGSDWAYYFNAPGAVTIDLAVTTAQNTGWGNDRLISIENLYGSQFGDTLKGNASQNSLNGYGGNDKIFGRQGNDTLSGDDGRDLLSGGAGSDYLYGGALADRFQFTQNTSGITFDTVDTIGDWNAADDQIDMPITGTSENYRESATIATSIETAAADAEASFPGPAVVHVFLYNSSTNTGYLLSDLDNDDAFETGVIISGAGSAAAMSFSDII